MSGASSSYVVAHKPLSKLPSRRDKADE